MGGKEQSLGLIQIRYPGNLIQRLQIHQDLITIGRHSDNTLFLTDDTVSRAHARLSYRNGKWVIEDLDSKNGTFLNGVRLAPMTPTIISNTTKIRIGSVNLRLRRRENKRLFWGTITAAGCLGLLVLLAVIFLFINKLRGQEKTSIGYCEQPPMVLLTKGSVAASDEIETRVASPVSIVTETAQVVVGSGTAGISTQPPARPIVSLSFLDLPFPYDGGNQNFGGSLQQFQQASQRSVNSGRINSFFDHYLPLYPASKDPNIPGGQEPAEPPIGENILIYTGELSPFDYYSGHPALDYSTFEHRQPTTPLFAAADGVITAVGEHTSSGALFVRIKHTVPVVGDFQTTYWHLHPDGFYEAMLGREGQYIPAGTRIGTMGNTGWSTGHHLHFEVRFDRNRDGAFSSGEVVDPYGYIPSAAYPVDPWLDRTGLESLYLWRHPLGVTAQVSSDGGGYVDTGGTGRANSDPDDSGAVLCASPGSFPENSQVTLSWAPDPPPSSGLQGSGNACVLSVTDAEENPVTSFEQPVRIVIPFDPDDYKNIEPESLSIYWMPPEIPDWIQLETTIDFENGLAVSWTDRPGRCALMGKPIQDLMPPITLIQASGVQSTAGIFYEQVTVSLSSSDDSGVEIIEYSLDAGSNWQQYEKPFVLLPGEIPSLPGIMDAEFFGGGPGVFLILASATDIYGNVEDPPAYLQISIDPSQDPDSAINEMTDTPSPTATVTPSATSTPTFTQTSTEQACEASLTILQAANCRSGPGTVYGIITGYNVGAELKITGQNTNPSFRWWRVMIPDSAASCWISNSLVQVSENASCVETVPDPPTPTPSPSSSPTSTPPSAFDPNYVP